MPKRPRDGSSRCLGNFFEPEDTKIATVLILNLPYVCFLLLKNFLH